VICLLNVNYAILRSARNALTVADLGGGAGSIPWYELCGTMPGAVLMTLGLTWLLNRYSIRRVFFITLFSFVGFFLVFAIGIYPSLPSWKGALLSSSWVPTWAATLLPQFASMLFFTMAELWKVALLTVLFWGFVNQYVSFERAKSFYAPLMLGGSIGTVLAGPIISLCTSNFLSRGSWSQSLLLIVLMVAAVSALTAFLFSALSKYFAAPVQQQREEEKKEKLSVWQSLLICCRSPFLMLLAWVTVADYIAYALGEVVFFDVLKQKFPDPRDYCNFMGKLSLWNGVLTAISAFFITPYLLKRCRWIVASLVTPVCILLTEGAFFFALWHPGFSFDVELIVFFGALFFCLARAAKYTLFDTSKEISFLLLEPLEKMQGKLVIDGMCSRLGRGGGSLVSLCLIQLYGGVLASAPFAGALALVIATTCVFATSRLGLLVEERRLATTQKS
jgi:AAA family ATP:ADP antiporter